MTSCTDSITVKDSKELASRDEELPTMSEELNAGNEKPPETSEIALKPIETTEVVSAEASFTQSAWSSGYLLSWIIFFLIAFFNLYEYLLRVFPSVVMIPIMSSYQIKATDFGQLTAYFYFIYAPMQLFVGALVDRYGPHYLLPLATLVCAIGAFLFAVPGTLLMAKIGRFLMGLGSAFAFVGGLKFLVVYFAPHRFGFLTGIIVSFSLLGGVLGQSAMATLLSRYDWRSLCYGIAFMGVSLFALMFISMRGQKTVRLHSVNWQQIFEGIRFLLKSRKAWLLGLVGCFFYLPITVFAELWGVSYLKVGYGFSTVEAAYLVSMVFLGWAVGCPLAGWISDRVYKPRLFMILGACGSLILLIFMLMMSARLKAWLPFLMFTLGFFGSTQILATCIMRDYVPIKIASTAISFLNTLVLMGGFLVQPFVGFLLDNRWQGGKIDGIRYYSADNYQVALMVVPAALLLGLVLSFFFSDKAPERPVEL